MATPNLKEVMGKSKNLLFSEPKIEKNVTNTILAKKMGCHVSYIQREINQPVETMITDYEIYISKHYSLIFTF